MGTVYRRGRKLWLKYRTSAGWEWKASGFEVGQEKLARALLRTIEAKVDAVAETGMDDGPLTLNRVAERWLKDRETRGVSIAGDDRTRLEKHVLPLVGEMILPDVRPRHIRQLVRDLSLKCGTEKGDLAPRTVRQIYGTLHTLLEDAVADEFIDHSPCALKRGELPKKIDKDPTWRAQAIFTRNEVEALISDERIPEDRRTLYAVLFLGGVRFGEAASLRWRAYDTEARPLGRLLISSSFDRQTGLDKSTKTERPREVPVHPTLARILATWKLGGCQRMTGTVAAVDDLILPSREGRSRNVSLGLRRFHQDLDRIGLRRRRLHDARRTFVTLCQADGARRDVLKWISHGPEGDILSLYTSLPWATLCEEIAKLKIEQLEGRVLQLPRVAQLGETMGERVTVGVTIAQKSLQPHVIAAVSEAGCTGLEGARGSLRLAEPSSVSPTVESESEPSGESPRGISEVFAEPDRHSVTRALELLDAGRVDLARAELLALIAAQKRRGG